MSADHLRDPKVRAAAAAARTAQRLATRPTTSPGSESTDWTPGTPVRVSGSGVLSRYKRRSGFVATVNAQTFPDGRTYAEVGVTWNVWKDWTKASAEAWFRVDELEER